MKIVSLDPLKIFPQDELQLKELGEFIQYDSLPMDENETVSRIKDAEIVIDYWTTITSEICDRLEKTKLIISAAAGYDWISLEGAKKKGFLIAHCPGNNAEAVAEYTWSLLLAASRLVVQAVNRTKDGEFEPSAYKGKELHGKTIGIIGYGTIGRRVAEIAEKAFNMKVLYTNSKSSREDLEKLLKESDFISVNAPINDATRGMIGKREFELMKHGIVLVNTGRGAVLDEEELYAALSSHRIFAAGLDVLQKEPFIKDHKLFHLSNVIITPHIAYNTSETDHRLSAQIVEIVKAFIEGSAKFIIPELKHIS